MRVDTEIKENKLILRISEDMSIKDFRDLKISIYNILDDNDIDVVLDISDLTYIGSYGIGVIITIQKLQEKRNKSFEVIANNKIKLALDLVDLSSVVKIVQK